MKLKLKDLGKIVTGFTPKKKEKDAWGEDIPFLTPSDYGLDRFAKTSRFLSDEWVSQRKSKIVSCPSISVTCIGSDMGKTVFNDVNIITNQQINSIYNIKTDLVSPLYLYYLLKSKREYLHFLGSGNGSTMPILNKRDFSNIEVELPSLKQQTQISNMLDVLDKKIELNNSINANLLELGRIVYQQLSFKNGLENIYEQLNILYGAPYKSKFFTESNNGLPLIRIRDLKTGTPQFNTKERTGKDVIVDKGDLLIGMDAEFHPTLWNGETSLLNQRVLKVKAKNKVNILYYYYALKPKMMFFENSKAGTTVIHLGKKDIDQIKLIRLNQKDEVKINNLFSPIWSKIVNNYCENKQLTILKDTLLNKYF